MFELELRVSSGGGWLAIFGIFTVVEIAVPWPFMVALESGLTSSGAPANEAARPLLLLLPLPPNSVLALRFSRDGCGPVGVLDDLPAFAISVVAPTG